MYEDLRGGLLLPSNLEVLMEELKRLNENVLAEVDTLLAKIATPVEISAPSSQIASYSSQLKLISKQCPGCSRGFSSVSWPMPLGKGKYCRLSLGGEITSLIRRFV
jgi:hypothetical protein